MSGLNGLLGIARDALTAQGYALGVTGQNVTNVNTPGYVRRDAILESVALPGAVAQGGVRATGTLRSADALVEKRWFHATSFASSAQERQDALSRVEGLFDDSSGSGFGTELQALFSSFSRLAATPNDPAARASVFAKADSLAARFRSTAEGLAAAREDLESKAQGIASTVNDLTTQIAKLNKDIATTEATGGSAADLRDRQGELVRQLSEKIEVQTLQNANGQVVVLSGGVALVEADKAAQLSVTLDPTDQLQIVAHRPSGIAVDITDRIDGGELSGIVTARDSDIVDVMGRLDQFASDIAGAVNAQHSAGFGLDGIGGRPLFAVVPPPGTAYALQVDAAMVGQPDRLAAASTVASLPSGSDNAVALSQLQFALLTGGGTRTASEGYGDLVGAVAQKSASAKQDSEVRLALQEQLQVMRDSVSGVSLDEEMVSLTKYQRGYEAAASLIKTVDDLLAQLIQQM